MLTSGNDEGSFERPGGFVAGGGESADDRPYRKLDEQRCKRENGVEDLER